MPRWFFSAIFAFVLCCLGFSAAAQGHVVARQHGCEAVALAHTQELLAAHASDAGVPADSGEESPGNDEQRHDCNEILFGAPDLFVPMSMSAQAPPPPPTLRAAPFLEHPKRPPRV